MSEKLKHLTENTDFSELCITSKAEVSYKDNIETVAITSKARGSKCSICWKIKEAVCDRANCALN
jgi:isoleucyl-tRNA synthetase